MSDEYFTNLLMADSYRRDMKQRYDEPRSFAQLPNYQRQERPDQSMDREYPMEQTFGAGMKNRDTYFDRDQNRSDQKQGWSSWNDDRDERSFRREVPSELDDINTKLDDMTNSIHILYILIIILLIITSVILALVGGLTIHAWMMRNSNR